MLFRWLFALLLLCSLINSIEAKEPIKANDIFAITEIGDARLSPAGDKIVYSQITIDQKLNRSISNLWLMPVNGGASVQLTSGTFSDVAPQWSPDGKMIAFASNRSGENGLYVIDISTSQIKLIAPWQQSNHYLSKSGEILSWSPDSRQIAFVATQRHEVKSISDPIVITRTQYKNRRTFSDNLTSHIFVVTVADQQVKQLTQGNFHEHSIAWSPRGDEILFASNREPDPDANFNYDLFAVDVSSGKERRLTTTPGVEFSPSWSPDGNYISYLATRRPLTTIDSVAEDSHVWSINRDGSGATEISKNLDRRCSSPRWSTNSDTVYFTAGDQGRNLIYRVARAGGAVEPVIQGEYNFSNLSVSGNSLVFTNNNNIAPTELWSAKVDGSALNQLTSNNAAFAANHLLVKPETINFPSVDGLTIEGWLLPPINFKPDQKYPMILSIHGGPHGMFGYGFNLAHQFYAANGYAVLYINPRGSSGYGQKFSDGCVADWGGGDYQDLMKGVDYALSKYRWIDANRLAVTGGSYGGYMTNWIVTQTDRFKAAIASASLSNLISFYSTSLYQDLIHAEFNGLPWDNFELLWQRSPLKHIKNVKTPTMLVHGEQDNDVHITQAEEMYMGLKRRNVESVLVRYPREGHGFSEPLHRVDLLERNLQWFDRFLK